MKRKKLFIFSAVILVLLVLCLNAADNAKYSGKTLESRQNQLCRNGRDIHISQEIDIDGYIISAINESSRTHGLAVFEPVGNGKYRLQSSTQRNSNMVVIADVYINSEWYNLFWADRPNLDYAQIEYSHNGKTLEALTFDASDNKILFCKTPYTNYTLSAVFYDTDGNAYE